ncbi:amino acid permease [Vagococcus intermedius]|uniref:Amino acid permease n=1 Tax=Vagococcus intermedius TaxID=2991418 RepID=A0AAF0CU42_9ENTE|nr:amino acid permease [Vagococcus intermedius]WEG73044.1 amino acid permease [Vagococcus intermedius]WEG75129.1 amino acid permease [Vagococcus intermedius]
MSQENTEMKRSLQTRHLSMIAIGGSIGTGLFLASGSAISQAGPGGALVAYALMGCMVYFLMTSLGEMATYMPVSGSFSTYATKFVDPAFGFALGWNYWFNWAITLAVEVNTAAIIMAYWLPDVPSWIFSLIFLGLIFAINATSGRSFAEAEYWFSMIKVVTVIIFIVIGLLTIFGIMGGRGPVGFENFTTGEAPFVGGIPALLSVFVVAGFSFQGTELIGLTAGESENPEESIPKAIKQVFWRIILFYIISIFIIAMLIPYTSPYLLGGEVSDVSTSPFTLVFQRAGLATAASILNAVILTAVLSAGNSGLYASSRMLHSMAVSGQAPAFLGRVNKRGVPLNAVIATTIVGGFAFLSSIVGDGFYGLLLAASGLTGFIAWLGIGISHLRFRSAFKAQNRDTSELKYKARWFPFGPIIALLLCLMVIIGQDIPAFVEGDWSAILITYMSIPLVVSLYLGYKIKNKTKLIPLKEIKLKDKK